MDIIKSVFLGLLQGFTEFLPVSSSGHLAIAQNFLGFESNQSVTFTVLLHLGTLAAVCIMYYRDVWMIIKGFFTLMAKLIRGRLKKDGLAFGERLFLLLLVASLPLIPAVFFEEYIESLSAISWVVGMLLILNGAILYISDRLSTGEVSLEYAPPKKAFFVGLIQMIAIFPGISRSGSTITGGLFAGFKREDAVKFSFLLSIPAILGANLLKFPDVINNGLGSERLTEMAVGVAAALISGIVAIKLLKYISKHKNFKVFSIYCIAAGAIAIIADIFI